MIDVLGPSDTPLFDTFTGASVGAINAVYLAAHADHGDHAIDGLLRLWSELDIREIGRVSPLAMWGWPHLRLLHDRDPLGISRYVGRSLLDPRPLENLLERVIPWDRFHANIRAGLVRGVMIPALDIIDGNTTVFTDLTDGVSFRPYPFLTSRVLFTDIKAEHLLAASALPFVYPARRLHDRYYMDGAVRFQTPIIPALRAGAQRVVAISLLDGAPTPRRRQFFPGLLFLSGQLLSALLLDPLEHDIDTLARNNRIVEILAETLDPLATAQAIAAIEREVPPGRVIPILKFQPSVNLEVFTADFIRTELGRGPLRRAFFRLLARYEAGQSLLTSFLFLDGRLAARLIELGRSDAHAARDRIIEFFRV